MTKNKTTKRALLVSVLALLLCASLLVGSTFAWFTDNVTSTNNIIKSGNLDVKLEYSTDLSTWAEVGAKTDIFKNEDGTTDLWEPGFTEVVYLKVSNVGSLALKYALEVNVASEESGTNQEGKTFWLSDHIVYGVDTQVAGKYADRATAQAAIENGKKTLNQGYATTDNPLKAGEENIVALVVYMPTTVGNVANHNGEDIPTINLGITLNATQLNAESDSFGPDYDKNATYSDVVYYAADTKDFVAALESISTRTDIETAQINLSGDVEWETGAGIGSTPLVPETAAVKKVTINGNGNTLTATGAGVGPIRMANGGELVFKNLTVEDESVSYAEDAWELTYLEFAGVLKFDKVTFKSGVQFEGEAAEFTNCTFISNEASVYAAWVSNGTASFANCTFTGTRGLKTHEDYGTEVKSIVVDGCTFMNISEKPGIAIGTLNADTAVTVKNSTFIGVQAGDQGLYIYETDTDVTTFNFTETKNTVAKATDLDIDETNKTVKIDSAEELILFANTVNAGGKTYAGYTVTLEADIDLANKPWTPIGQTGATEFKGVFDGNGKTIKNLYVDNSAYTDGHTSSGLFGWAESGVTIQNVTVDGATVKGNHNVAVIVGYTYSSKVINCHVKNATVVCTHANGDACGDKAGAIVGYAGDESRFTDCSATDCTITAGRDAGQLIGTGYNKSVSGCTATNVVVSATGDCNREGNINNAVIGRVIG